MSRIDEGSMSTFKVLPPGLCSLYPTLPNTVDELEGYWCLDVLRYVHGLKRSVLMYCQCSHCIDKFSCVIV